MDNKKLSREDTKKLIFAGVLLVIGVLFCCSLAMAKTVFSIVIGVSIMVIGVVYVLSTLLREKALLTGEGIIGAVLLGIGLCFALHTWVNVIIDLIPWLLIFVGAVIAADSFLKFFINKVELVKFIVELIVGVGSTVLGICLLTVNGFAELTALMLGIVMIVYAAYLVTTIIFSPKKD